MSNTYRVGWALGIAAFLLLTIGFHTAQTRDNLLTPHAAYIIGKRTPEASSAAGLANPSCQYTQHLPHRWHVPVSRELCFLGRIFLYHREHRRPGLRAWGGDGSRRQPNSNGWIVQATNLPWQNMQFTLQGWFYDKFNGASGNYDGSGRSASNNSTPLSAGTVRFLGPATHYILLER